MAKDHSRIDHCISRTTRQREIHLCSLYSVGEKYNGVSKVLNLMGMSWGQRDKNFLFLTAVSVNYKITEKRLILSLFDEKSVVESNIFRCTEKYNFYLRC